MLRSLLIFALLATAGCGTTTAEPADKPEARAKKGEGRSKAEAKAEAKAAEGKPAEGKPEKEDAGPKKEQQIPLVPGTTAEAILAKLAGKATAVAARPPECHEVSYAAYGAPTDAIRSYLRTRRTGPAVDGACTTLAAPDTADAALKWTSSAAFTRPTSPTIAATGSDAKHPGVKVEEDRLYSAGAEKPTLRFGFVDKIKWTGDAAKKLTSADALKAAFTATPAPAKEGCKPWMVFETRLKIEDKVWSLEISTLGSQQIVELSSEVASDEAAASALRLLGDLVAKERPSPLELALASCDAKP